MCECITEQRSREQKAFVSLLCRVCLLALQYASLLNTFASFAAAPLIVTYSTASPIARVAGQ